MNRDEHLGSILHFWILGYRGRVCAPAADMQKNTISIVVKGNCNGHFTVQMHNYIESTSIPSCELSVERQRHEEMSNLIVT